MFSGSVRAIVTGVAATAVLIAVLCASRLFRVTPEAEKTEVVEISAYLPPPEEPPMDEAEDEPEEQEVVEELSPPIPALDLMVSPELDAPALPVSSVKFNPNMSIDVMEMDRAPADLPVRKVVKPVYKPKVKAPSAKPKITPKSKPKAQPKSKPKPVSKPKPKPKSIPKPVLKSYYSSSELDGKPREVRQGSFTWPSRAKGKSGTVSLYIEISTSGRVSVLSILSSTDAALNDAAKKLARSSRYTSPKKNGKSVKARFSKTYRLINPR